MSDSAAPAPKEQSGFFAAPDNLRLYQRSFTPPTPRAAVLVVHGYADHSGRYLEIMRALAAQGFAVHAFDYRGHGQADGRRGHVDTFSDYLGDFGAFLAKVEAQTPGLQRFVLAHSHGALLTLSYALAHPEAPIAGAVLSAPYLKLNFQPPRLKVAAAKLLSGVIPWLPIANELNVEMLTRDPVLQQATARDPLYNRTTTPRWFTESNLAQANVRQHAADFRWPALFLQGEADPITAIDATRDFFNRAGSTDKRMVSYPGFRHEILNEVGREKVFSEIEGWLSAQLAPASPPRERK